MWGTLNTERDNKPQHRNANGSKRRSNRSNCLNTQIEAEATNIWKLYATFEEWKYTFKAYMGIPDNIYPNLLSRAERATTALTDAELTAAAGTPEEAERWIQLANNPKYILISTTTAAAATVCRQHQTAMGLEVYRQLCQRFSTPLGTRSIGYLTELPKPTFNHNNFEEWFSTWELEVEPYERDSNTQLPDKVKIAALVNKHQHTQ